MDQNAGHVNNAASRRRIIDALANDKGATQIIAVLEEFGRPGGFEDGVATAARRVEGVLVGIDEVGAGFGDSLGEEMGGVRGELSAIRKHEAVVPGKRR